MAVTNGNAVRALALSYFKRRTERNPDESSQAYTARAIKGITPSLLALARINLGRTTAKRVKAELPQTMEA